MKKALLIISLLSLFFIGCAPAKPDTSQAVPQAYSRTDTQTSEKELKSYIVGDEKIAHVGDEIIRYGTLKQTITKSLAYKPLINKTDKNGIKITPEMILPVTNKSDDLENTILWINGGEVKNIFGGMFPHIVHFQVYRDGFIASTKARLSSKYVSNEAVDVEYFDRNDANKQIFTVVDKVEIVSSENTFEGVLVYAGIDRETIKIFYKEFHDDSPKPVFTQELTYDISKDKIIRFKNIKMEIIVANSQDLVFRVLSDI